MACKFNFKILLTIVLYVIIGCEDIPRDNILDPKNTGSYKSQKVLVEAFVNTQNPWLYNEYMISALNDLAEIYEEKIIVMEYHRNTTEYSDPLHLNSNEDLYERYLSAMNDDQKGVPDVFINGTRHRIQGASSIASAKQRVEEAIINEIHRNCYFTIECAFKTANGQLTPMVKLARMGNNDAENILIRGILISEYDNTYLSHVVTMENPNNLIPQIANGEVQSYTLDAVEIDDNALYQYFVVCITNADKSEIYQSELFLME